MNQKQLWAAGLASLVLAACGGGAEPHVTVKVAGLESGKSFKVALTNSATGVVTPLTLDSSVVGSGWLSPDSYTISVVSHPQRQLCSVVSGVSFVATTAGASAAIDCHTTYLNDTGIVASIGDLDGDDAETGRDAAVAKGENLSKLGAGKAGFDMTKICADGSVVDGEGQCATQSYNNEWACTRDNVTQLMWDIRSLKDSDAAPAGLPGGPAYWCGVPDANWHQATTHELISIVDNTYVSSTLAKVDSTYFPNVLAEVYLASEDDYLGQDWGVQMRDFGAVGLFDSGSIAAGDRNVLWVAELPGSSVNSKGGFSVNSGEWADRYVIVDSGRDLIWLFDKTPEAQVWVDALASVDQVNADGIGGFDDWRLPNKNEIDSLLDRTKSSPTVKEGLLTGVDPTVYQAAFWTSSKWFESAKHNVWRADFTTGDLLFNSQDEPARVVYVRNRVTSE